MAEYTAPPIDHLIPVPGGPNPNIKPQPANSELFSTDAEATEVVKNLRDSNTVPIDIPIEVVRDPEARSFFGPVDYGKSPRRPLYLRWTQAGSEYIPNVGLLFGYLKRVPAGAWILYQGNIVRR